MKPNVQIGHLYDMMHGHMHDPSPIKERLTTVRRRLALRAVQRSSALAIFGASVLYAVLHWLTNLTAQQSFSAAGAAGVLLLIALAVGMLIRLPSMQVTAQIADGHFQLQERMSSALEALDAMSSTDLSQLQLQDALRHVQKVDGASMVTLRPSRSTWATLAFSAALLVSTVFLPGQAASSSDLIAHSPRFSEQELTRVAEEIRQVADNVAATESEHQTEYLDTVVRSLETLSQQVERGELTRSELTEALEHIAEHLTLAGIDESEARAQLASIGNELPATPESPPANQAESIIEQSQQNQTEELATVSVPAPEPEPTQGISNAQDITAPTSENLEVESDSESSERRFATEEDGDAFGHYMGPDPEMVARLEQRRQELLMAGDNIEGAVPVGAAERSTPGGGDIGGDGAGELAAGEQQTDVDFAFDTDTLQLPASSNTEGQRITVEASPDTVFTETGGAAQFAFSHWLPSEEAPLDQSLIGLRQQDAVRRYFLPLDPEDEQSNQKGTTQ